MISEIVTFLRRVIGTRRAGPVFLRQRFLELDRPLLDASQSELETICERRFKQTNSDHSRSTFARVAAAIWREAGAVEPDTIRTSFIRTAKRIGHPEATCPKSWRHTFATLLQDANVDPLIRQITLGHRPTTGGNLGMTANYTHTRPETQRDQIEGAMRETFAAPGANRDMRLLWRPHVPMRLLSEGREHSAR